jgi:hypothetical protein
MAMGQAAGTAAAIASAGDDDAGAVDPALLRARLAETGAKL